MSRSSTITHNLPEFPYSPAATDDRRRLSALLSNSHFVTTVVSSPSLASPPQPLTRSCADPQDNADPPQSPPPPAPPPHNADSSSTDIAAHPPAQSQSLQRSPSPSFPEIPSVTAPLRARPQSPSVGIETVRLKSSKHASRAYNSKHPPILIGTGQECLAWPPPRHRSTWRRFKRMGNHFVTPLRSMGLCFTSCTGGHRAVAFCEGFSSHDVSPGSSWYSPDEYPPDFIRTVLENNVLLGNWQWNG